MNIPYRRTLCWHLAAFALATGVASEMTVAQSRPSTATKDIEKLKQVALQPGIGTTGDKVRAVGAIRDMGGKQALLDLVGKVEPREVKKAVIDCLSQMGGEEVKRRLADLATNAEVGAYAVDSLGRLLTAKDEAVLAQLLARVKGNVSALPARNTAAVLRLFGQAAYRQSAAFVRQAAEAGDAAIQRNAVEALGRVGEAKDVVTLWAMLEKSKDRSLREAIVASIGALGSAGDAKQLRELVDSIHSTEKQGTPPFLLARSAVAARAAILARVTTQPVGATIKLAHATPVAGAAVLGLTLPKGCAGLLVAVGQEKRVLAQGLVRGETVRLELPEGSYTITVRPLLLRHGRSLGSCMGIASLLYDPEGLLQLGPAVVLEKIQAKRPVAKGVVITNAERAQDLDDRAKQIQLSKTGAGPILLRGKLARWPRADVRGVAKAIPTNPLFRRGWKLYSEKTYVYADWLDEPQSGMSGKQVCVLGQVCRQWDGVSYSFVILASWPAATEVAASRNATTPAQSK